MSVKTKGLADLKARILRTLPKAARDKMKAANKKNSTEFLNLVRTIIPREQGADPRHPGLLASTLTETEVSETGYSDSIGGPNAPYPLHLEAGHRAENGAHVPGRRFWNPAKAVLKKRARGRANRAANEAVKMVAAGKLAQ